MRKFACAKSGRARHGQSTAPGFIAALIFTATASSGAAAAEEAFEQHHAHEHGKVTLNVALDGGELVVELDAPAANVVGFEHAPRDASERAATSAASALIRGGIGLFGTPESAKCRFEKTDFTEPAWKTGGGHEGAAHDPDESHSSHGGEHEHHADYEARFTYRCAFPKQLTWIEPWILAKLLNVVEARVNLITPTGQRSQVVKSAHDRIPMG
ncbi:MAG: DUF2796 domain-containing protein [Gammaproteobacteria bacterium]